MTNRKAEIESNSSSNQKENTPSEDPIEAEQE